MMSPVLSRLELFRGLYWRSRLRRTFLRTKPTVDVVFVLHPAWRGWILDAIAGEVARRLCGTVHFHYSLADIPPARAYVLMNQTLVTRVLVSNPCVWAGKRFAWFTHPSEIYSSERQFMYALGQLDGIFFLCSEFQRQMTARGLEATKTEVLLAGADPSLFLGHERRDGAVGLCTAYYERKDPDRIFRIAQRMPHRRFLLVGRNWNKYPRIAQISKLPNFEYVESPYERYPELYARMDVFLSPARLEGGPVPLLEAMMSNAVPVASRTGFAPDLIKHGLNGYLFDADAPIDDICALIDLAYEHTSDIRETVMDLTWDRLANRVRTWLE